MKPKFPLICFGVASRECRDDKVKLEEAKWNMRNLERQLKELAAEKRGTEEVCPFAAQTCNSMPIMPRSTKLFNKSALSVSSSFCIFQGFLHLRSNFAVCIIAIANRSYCQQFLRPFMPEPVPSLLQANAALQAELDALQQASEESRAEAASRLQTANADAAALREEVAALTKGLAASKEAELRSAAERERLDAKLRQHLQDLSDAETKARARADELLAATTAIEVNEAEGSAEMV